MRVLIVLATVAGLVAGGVFRAAGAHEPGGMTQMSPMAMSHMALTDPRPERPGDRQRADAIVAGAKRAMTRYPDAAAAERAGFAKFLPGVPLPIEHYTSPQYAREQWGGQLDPDHPTSLIFERHGTNLALVGVMYTAGASFTPDRLDALVPLSVARWHRHVDYCFAPPGLRGDPRFGLAGTIASQSACEAAHGRWVPQIFGWMVHVWPNERDPAKVWAVDRADASGTPSMSHPVSPGMTMPMEHAAG
jgi:hypothetical protein